MSLSEFSIKRPVTTIMLFVSMVVVGLIAAVRLPLEMMPDMSFPFVFVQLPYAGSTPEEVERNVVRPAEEALATLSGVQALQSRSQADSGSVMVLFRDWSKDVSIAASEARERLDAIRDQLPDDFQRYFVFRWSATDEPVITLQLTSDSDLRTQSEMIDREFKRPLERLAGVAKIEIEGVPNQELEVAVKPDRLSAAGLALNDLVTKLSSANFSVSAGQIDNGGLRYRVQPIGELKSVEMLRNMVVASNGTRLGDIADVQMRDQRMNYSRTIDGKPMVAIDIYKERAANIVEISKMVREAVKDIDASPEAKGIKIDITDDQGEGVISSLMALAEAGAIGLVLSILVLYFFLRHWPSTLMVTLAIPICFIMTLGFMYFANVTLNILTMMGLLLAIGMLVDNAVVVVESIYQERERYPDNPMYASVVGTRHVAIALTAGTLCHCIVFVPNLFGPRNMITIQMSQIAITISVSLLASWLVAVSLIPMLSARMKTPPAVSSKKGLIARLQSRYATLLRWTLEHRGKSIMGIVLVVLISVVPMMLTKKSMFDADDPAEIEMFYSWNGSYSKDQMGEEVKRVEDFINKNRKRFKVTEVSSRYSEQGWGRTTLKIDAKDAKVTKDIQELIRKEMPKSARAKIGIGQQDGGQGGMGQDVRIRLVGDSTQRLEDISKEVIPLLSQRKELRDVRIDTGDRNSEVGITVNRERAAAYGFSTQDVARYIGIALRGSSLREFNRGSEQIPVNVRFEGAEESTLEQLRAFMVTGPDGRQIPLMAMVDVGVSPSATQIQRLDRQTSLQLTANVSADSNQDEAKKAMEDVLKAYSFPPGYSYSTKGFGLNIGEQEAMAQMGFNLLIALVMIYVVMAAVFESLLFPAAIMSGVVFSIFGVFWLFWITGTTFNIMAFIGILVLMGVVVNNGIVMIEHINNLRRRGMSRTDALVEGSRERLRPILMTMGTAILAMIPIAVSNTQIGGEGPPYFPMARAIAGGLAFSTLVSLLFLPTIYALLDDWRTKSGKKWAWARDWQWRGKKSKLPPVESSLLH